MIDLPIEPVGEQRDRNASSGKPAYLYRCYDRYGVLLYAGITDNPEQRMKNHASQKFWWGDVAKVTNMAFKTREQALWAEWAVISTCHPLHNADVSIPPAHRCPPPPDPPLPIEGHIYMLKAFATIEANADIYRRLGSEVGQMIADTGAPARPKDKADSRAWSLASQFGF